MRRPARKNSSAAAGLAACLLAVACLVSLGLSTAIAAGLSPPPPSAAAIQAWVFDGAYESSSLFGVAFTSHGMVAQLKVPVTCGAEDVPVGGFLSLSPAELGVFAASPQYPPMFGSALDPAVSVLPPPPIDPALVSDDCVALANEGAVNSYIAGLEAQMTSGDAQLMACSQALDQRVADACVLFEEIQEKCGSELPNCFPTVWDGTTIVQSIEPLEASGELPDPFPFPCHDCQQALLYLPTIVSATIDYLLQSCQDNLEMLNNQVIPDMEAILQGQSTIVEFEFLAGWIAQLANWDWSLSEFLSRFAEQSTKCSHENLVANCEACPEDPAPLPAVFPSGAVSIRQSASSLGRLAGMFQSESKRTDDAALAARYAGLAARLTGLGDDRVLEVSTPGALPFTRQYVALRRADLPDDGEVPLAVVLTLVRSQGGEPPALNSADQELLQQMLEAFKNTLDPGRICPTCPPPR